MEKILISWSGEISHKVAVILRNWLPTVLPQIEPWVSSEDINKGDRWSRELAKQLSEISFGIICVDPTNIHSPWLNFEAGALSKSFDSGRVFPLLIGLSPDDIRGPLSQFQLTTLEKNDVLKLIKSINHALRSDKVPTEKLERVYEISWLGLKIALESAKISFQSDKITGDNSLEDDTEIAPTTSGLNITASEKEVLRNLVLIQNDTFPLVVPNIARSIAARVRFPIIKVQQCLSRLEKHGLVKSARNGGWLVTSEGLDLLIDNDLI
ncbi:TIR domain-containing protein [Candidatus Parcubacteria bacterium]|nr:MAG: TIR domain-containing protein [Candidatus Parcubacteria bacterium]